MPHVPPFPDEAAPESIDENEKKILYPEVILIDDREGKQKTQVEEDLLGGGNSSNQKKLKKKPLSLRFICVLGLVFCFVFGLGIFIWSIVLTAMAIFSLFQNRRLNRGVGHFWKICFNTLVAAFGFTLGLLSPTLGLGLLAVYFSLKGDLSSDDLFRKILQTFFRKF